MYLAKKHKKLDKGSEKFFSEDQYKLYVQSKAMTFKLLRINGNDVMAMIFANL